MHLKIFLCFYFAYIPLISVCAELPKTITPQVLVIGDIIYKDPVLNANKYLKGKVELTYWDRPTYHSGIAVKEMKKIVSEKKWDLIFFNFGLNDLMNKDPATKTIRAMHEKAGGIRVTPETQYKQNLSQLVAILKKTGAKVIWASTTPIVNSNGILTKGSELIYNTIAAKIMKEYNVPICDMYTHALKVHKTVRHPKTYNYKTGIPLHLEMSKSILDAFGLYKQLNSTLKVFVMVGGQMHIGSGVIHGNDAPSPDSKPGSLDYLVTNEKTKIQYQHLLDKDGFWAYRKDVWIKFNGKFNLSGNHGVRFGGNRNRHIGPEYSFGITLGDYFENQVYIHKTYIDEQLTSKDITSSLCGKEGRSYKTLLKQIRESLRNLENNFLEYNSEYGFELSGIVLNFGEKDQNMTEYKKNTTCLINGLRTEFKLKDLPIVLVGSGRGGYENTKYPELIQTQQEITKTNDAPEKTIFTDTRAYWPESKRSPFDDDQLWHGNAQSFYQVGEAVARDMIKLLEKGS